jgi:hypothetical protein
MLETIQSVLNAFTNGNLTANALSFFAALGYASERQQPLDDKTFAGFSAYLNDEAKFSEKNALVAEWRYVDLLFQLTGDELNQQAGLFKIDDRITSYLFFALELKADSYSRTALSQITRELNKVFPIPVMLLFKYGEYLTLAVIDRQPHQRDDARDVLRKVTLIKDIRFAAPHRAHLEILHDLSLPQLNSKFTINNFLDLHQAWQKVLDTKELNKRFFKELANWYFWAVDNVTFPADEEKDEAVRNATSVIRLITRLMFVWFLKEKGLVSDKLFDADYLKTILHSKDESSYYKAILQNLFFATLNSTMGERKFIVESSGGRNNQHFVHNVFRYQSEFCQPAATVKELFEPIPFLNGGLFECLDKQTDAGRIRVDGFSDHPKNVLRVPDELFFGAEHDVDLNEIYGTRNKKYKVRGLIHLLNSYKFTIAENTPIEEEIALDPELLGKVFENLLANYNPETRTTARKQTGSFYTPREIVNYMVDESLIAYLKTKLQTETTGFASFTEAQTSLFGNDMRRQQVFELPVYANRWHGQDEALEAALRDLLGYDRTAHDFNETETEILIKAIDTCQILDPACGSGAFPMGILLKLVHLLEKLDPDNAKWRAWQEHKAKEEAGQAFKIANQTERDERLKEISDVFQNNSSDYGRKLFLIENCIYGVDIQPVAIQIAKLRFFISLIVDQDFNDDAASNRGIRPLPNLETKFVAANTLLGLEMSGLKPNGIDVLEANLKDVRAKHFGARTRKTKEKYRLEDKRIRTAIADLLKQAGFPETSADQISGWNPYDQNTKADWFDAEWMFGVEKGFDIVIGNPPYVRADSGDEHLELRRKLEQSGNFETLWEKWDLYVAFIELGYKMLKPNGITTMIVSDAYCHSKYAQKSQDWFLKNSRILALDFLSNLQVFEAAVHNVTYFFQKAEGRNNQPKRRNHKAYFGDVELLQTDLQPNLTRRAFFPEDKPSHSIAVPTTRLSEICYISKGMVVHANEKTAKGSFELSDLVRNERDAEHSKPFVEGKYLARWLPLTKKWIEWNTQRAPSMFSRPTFPELYEVSEKLISVDMSAGIGQLKVCYDNQRLLHNHSAWSFVPWKSLRGVKNNSLKKVARYRNEKPFRADLPRREELEKTSENFQVKFLLGVMNSQFAYEFLRTNRRSNIHLYPDDWKPLPIPNATAAQQSAITALVDKILAAKKADANAETKHWEAEIDALVYQLYGLTNEEIAIVEGR